MWLLFVQPSPPPIAVSQVGGTDVVEDSRWEEIKSELFSDLPRVVTSYHLDLPPSILSTGSASFGFQLLTLTELF